MFNDEEKLVAQEFTSAFQEKVILFNKLLKLYESFLYQLSTPPEEYNKYCAAILAGLNLKSFYSAFDRLSKGYLGDSETIFKKILEGFLAEVYFYEHPNKAKEWTEGKRIEALETEGRKGLSKVLDKINETKHFFPTDYPNFFTDYIYKIGYSNSNKASHLDFEFVHMELGLENDPTKFATTLVIGPKYDKQFMETMLNRLIMFCMFQITYIKENFQFTFDNQYEEFFSEVKKLFSTT